MRVTFAALTTIAVMVIAPAPVFAKGDTVRITITGGDLAAPIEITDPAIVRQYNVWAGGGTSSNQPHSIGIDWTQGMVEPPKGVPVYEVCFVISPRWDPHDPAMRDGHHPGTYLVRYAIASSTKQGYVYLPGKKEPEYRDNVFLIYRDVEGNWFHAWDEWEKLANPLIAKARNTH
jgi:hypothetical protein